MSLKKFFEVPPVRFAVAGVGNCASALLQGIWSYRSAGAESILGIEYETIGGLRVGDLHCVAAFDIDSRKVGRPLEEAIFAEPNCVQRLVETLPNTGVTVKMGDLQDGNAPHMERYPEHASFRVAARPAVDLVEELRRSEVEVLVCYVPVGSELAARTYAEACLAAGVAFVNCMPVFLASDPKFAERYRKAGLPMIGDDIKSQLGATIVHRSLMKLFHDRGCIIDRSYQLNVGGNTDFLNMLARERLDSKKQSKTNSVQSVLRQRMGADDLHVGPSDYVPWLRDNKVALIRIEGRGFCGAQIEMDIRLSVQDSPNSAGMVIDALRCAAIAKRRGIGGPLEEPSAYLMKSPPRQMDDWTAKKALDKFLASFEADQRSP